ncbi:hypothetical protein BDV93DRAFT_523979 [Ceratobasidium sp. AG-I]|nr:hypothetical protein BDV93DRAFT_523979 [Ceratobasidium sp. AG-I]
MSRAGIPPWPNGGEGKRQSGGNKPGNTLNGHPSHNHGPSCTNTSQLFQTYSYGILRLPVSVFIEITAYLGVEELLFLARTTTHFRRVLMTRSSAYIWRRALASLAGLPPCPSTMTEPQYIALLFTEDCSLRNKSILHSNSTNRPTRSSMWRMLERKIHDFVVLRDRGLLSEIKAVSRQLADLKAASGDWAKLAAWKQEKRKELSDRRKVSTDTIYQAIVYNFMSLARRPPYTVYPTKSRRR